MNILFTLLLAATFYHVDASVWCYRCVSSQPGCGEPFDFRWFATTTCDKCVKIIERKGSDVVITRECLSKIQYSRHDVPADKYEGCRPAATDVRLAHYVNNSIRELDVRRQYYDEVTWCFCEFDHWCNSSARPWVSATLFSFSLLLLRFLS